jgi:hypothetical protein
MPSPFPGMNPYLEHPGVWVDFHDSLIYAIRKGLNGQIRPGYIAKVEELLFIHELASDERRLLGQADMAVAESGKVPERPQGTAVRAPVYGTLAETAQVEHHPYLEIRDRECEALITIIEVLSPSNKYAGPDHDLYLAKRRQILASGTHLVELDLLRGGPRLPLNGMPDCDYCAVVSRYEERPSAGIWPVLLREKLPEIPIPLRSPDPDAMLDLKQAIDLVYDDAGYEDFLYRRPPRPPLNESDAKWAAGFVGKAV